ncbi:MAG: ketopantoate reductase family protein [Lachnospiraceae bacterium]|nr:ketopantoate reductase family protein [Lachnospiraceae bacterium]
MKINTVGIIGRGALGVMYGKCLADSLGNENVFFIADEKRTARYRETELFCNGECCSFSYRTPAEAVETDLLIFAVKFMGMQAAIEAVRPFVGEKTLILSVLNGITSEQLLEEAFGARHVLYACVQGMDAGKDKETVTYKNVGYISVGNKDKSQDERLSAVQELFERVGLAYEIPDDVVKKQWSKLMLNTGVNQVTAVYGAPYGAVQKEGEARTMMIEAMKEVQRVAAYQDVELTDEDLADWLSLLDTLNPEGFTSMCQDMRAGRKTEVELFSGTMLRLAKEAGISLPVNEFLYERIRELEGEERRA